jgi:hypothetical protein
MTHNKITHKYPQDIALQEAIRDTLKGMNLEKHTKKIIKEELEKQLKEILHSSKGNHQTLNNIILAQSNTHHKQVEQAFRRNMGALLQQSLGGGGLQQDALGYSSNQILKQLSASLNRAIMRG